MARHTQVRIMTPDRQMFAFVDEGMVGIISCLWRMGIKTQYSCENSMGLAYILLPANSARKLEKAIYRAIKHRQLSHEAVGMFRCFVNEGGYIGTLRIFKKIPSTKRPGYKTIKTVWEYERRLNVDRKYMIERSVDNHYGFRTTYRWDAARTEDLHNALLELEASQK